MKYPDAIWAPMPDWKQNGGTNKCQGVVMHSMVGPYSAALGELKSPTRRASWHFSVLQDGTVYQHADTAVRCWHAGSLYNNSTIGIEHEGGLTAVEEPLTAPQRAASVALVLWLAKVLGFPRVRRVGLWEHNEVSVEGTQCPSGRIPWEFYVKEEEMTDADRAAFAAVLEQLGALGKKIDDLGRLMSMSLPLIANGQTDRLQQILAYLKVAGGG